jgi:hypothetical protein
MAGLSGNGGVDKATQIIAPNREFIPMSLSKGIGKV